jgi:hypothetical protein
MRIEWFMPLLAGFICIGLAIEAPLRSDSSACAFRRSPAGTIDGGRWCEVVFASPSAASSTDALSIETRRKAISSFDFLPAPHYGAYFNQGIGASDLRWFVQRDHRKRVWISGASHFAPAMSEIYLRTPERISEDATFAVLINYFKQNSRQLIHPSKMGLALHIDSPPLGQSNYQIAFPVALKEELVKRESLEAQEHLAGDFRKFVFDGYRKRMSIDEDTLERLKRISESVEDRTILFVKTKESYLEFRPSSSEIVYRQDPRKLPADPLLRARARGRLIPAHFTLEAGAAVVLSRTPEEALPLELLTGFHVPREKGLIFAEIGRFYVDKDKEGANDPEASLRTIALITSFLAGSTAIDRIVIETDAARSRLFRRYGFSPIHSRKNFAGETEYIMQARPLLVAERALAILSKRAADEDDLPMSLTAPEKAFLAVADHNFLDPRDPKSPIFSLGGPNALLTALSEIHDIARSQEPAHTKHSAVINILEHAPLADKLTQGEREELAKTLEEGARREPHLNDVFREWFEARKKP